MISKRFCFALIVAALAGWELADRYTDSPKVVREYEDGSGVLSDGRSFCINDEPCEDK